MISKESQFDPSMQEVSKVAKALSHPARIEILKVLAKQKECMCGDIVNIIPLAQSTVSQHLKFLKAAGLIKGKIDGPKVCYCLNPEKMEKFRDGINDLISAVIRAEEVECC